MSLEKLTNQPDLWHEINLPEHVILWSLYHQCRYRIEDLKKLPTWSTAKVIVLIDQEAGLVDDVTQLDARVHLWDSTISTNSKIHTYLFWFDWVNEINDHLNLCAKLIPNNVKQPQYFFDALLGGPRPHRNFLRKLIHQFPNRNKILLGSETSSFDWNHKPDSWIQGGSFETGHWRPPYKGSQTANISCFLPYEIFNNSWFSIVAENIREGEHIFYSEKTAKPLLAKRLFVMFGSQGTLRMLKTIGYKTFDSVIDESYDDIEDSYTRWSAAWQQIVRLTDFNPVDIYEKIQSVVEHNHRLFVSTNWKNNMKKEIKDLIDSQKI
jgi:hypothetical protein